jgi:hypothetical protein
MFNVTLSFAELTFLLADTQGPTLDRLCVRRWDDDEAVRASALATLIARELLRAEGDTAIPIPELIPFIDTLSAPLAWVDIALARDDDAGAVHIFEGDAARIFVTARPFGVYHCAQADQVLPLAEACKEVVGRFLASEPGDVLLTSAGEADRPPLAIRRLSDGVVETAGGLREVGSPEVSSLDGALAKVVDYLAD